MSAAARSTHSKHASWISAPSPSYVGALSAGGVAELGKQGIVVSDQVVRDLDIPIMQTALDLMDLTFKLADDLGVGAEVRAGVYALRGAQYAGNTVAAWLGVGIGGGANAAAAASAGSAVLTGIGGVAALGTVFVVAVVLSDLFGGGDAEAAAKASKRAQDSILKLRMHFSLSDFAAEQDQVASAESLMALTPWFFGSQTSSDRHARAAKAQKLATFYRTADKQLPKPERELFVSLSNLARWQSALAQYGKMSQSAKDNFDSVGFGKSAPRLPYQLKAPIEAETAKLEKLAAASGATRPSPGAASVVLLLAAAVGGIYAAYNPSGAAALARSAGGKITGAARAGAAKVREIL